VPARDTAAFYRSFGELVRKHRDRLELTQEGLGELIGLSRTSITNIEKGRQHVALHQLYALARALKIPATALLPRDQDAPISEWVSSKLPAGTTKDVAAWANQLLDDRGSD
jgi:transcriptional regulator with XRE-family HTH domain